jgi:pimeloyl-ACP methyl ester carboxylesterase
MKRLGVLLLIIVALLAALPPLMDREGGDGVVKVADDTINFELSGPEGAPLVVLVHGVSGPMMVWDKLVPLLNGNGFRTLRFDLFGRGGSGRPPDGRYDLPMYVSELETVLQLAKVPPGTPFALVGSSMGCMVASEYVLKNPSRVNALALIGPAGFPLVASPLAKLLELRWVGDWAMRVFGDKSLAAHNRRYFFAPERFTEFQRRFVEQLRIKGSKHAILMTFRNVPLQSYLEGYERLGAVPVRKLVIWGKEDDAFPFDNSQKLLLRLPDARLVAIASAGHLPQYEQDQVAGPALLGFLRDKQ